MGLLLRFLLIAVLVFAGWILGSLYPAPAFLTNLVAARTESLAARIEGVDLEALRQRLSPEDYATLRQEAAKAAADAGEAILVERGGEPLPEHDPAPPAAGGFARGLALCPSMTVANAPPVDAERNLANYAPVVDVNGVDLAVNPTRQSCLSSGFGARSGREHKGVDLHNPAGGPVLAAADGVVIEKKYRDDYGNMLLIDHGQGVYTRYAHLSNFADGVAVGAHVSAGQEIGLMGNTASYAIPVHLHFELLLGDYSNPRASFGLTPRDPFSFPRAS